MQKGIKVVPQDLIKLFHKENDEKRFECENWGQAEDNPVVLIKGMAATELLAFMDDLIWRKELETVAAVSGDWYPKKDIRFLAEEKYGKKREELLTAIECYVDCSLILSVYPKTEEKTDQWEYDLEIYDGESELCVCEDRKTCKVISKKENWVEKLSEYLVQHLS